MVRKWSHALVEKDTLLTEIKFVSCRQLIKYLAEVNAKEVLGRAPCTATVKLNGTSGIDIVTLIVAH
jgi:hypothetical protein